MATPRSDDLTLAAEVRDLAVSFSGRRVLQGLTLKLPARRLTVIIGPSGSGKTTFLRAFNRLNEYFPDSRTSGAIHLRLNGQWQDIYRDGFDVTELRRRIGMVFQTPNLLPMSIEKNIALPLRLVMGAPRSEIPPRVEWALRVAHLWDEVKDRLRASALTLSGGQQQRLCLARVLALEPDLLLLDEPTASLDFRAAGQIEELLAQLKERYPVLAVSHSLGQARRLADLLLVMKEGAIVRTLECDELQPPDLLPRLLEEIF
ncbi:MAG: ATP-binding cassette domain-containing protein [Syntrophobacterales bacterium]|jgi:phosphate transport system ATP-binding protein|nr:ATP-binding cassette domain-containing protein [Syntrophobacterales bacterium]